MLKLMDKKIIAILRKLFFLNWPYVPTSSITSSDLQNCRSKKWGKPIPNLALGALGPMGKKEKNTVTFELFR